MPYLRPAMGIVRHIPNTITCLNLLCGCVAAMMAATGDTLSAALLVVAGAGFDFLDGFAARLLKVASPIGKELDSLADVVTFGLVPGLVLLSHLADAQGVPIALTSLRASPIVLIPLCIPMFSALRLAKFNVDTRQSYGFRGLPTPASALWCISVPLVMESPPDFLPQAAGWVSSAPFLIGSALVLSALMVSDLPLMAIKFRGFGWRGNEVRYGFVLMAVALLISLGAAAIPAILLLYLIVSTVQHRTENKA